MSHRSFSIKKWVLQFLILSLLILPGTSGGEIYFIPTPSKPSGTTSAYVGTSYLYDTVCIAPDGCNLFFEWDFGDGPTVKTNNLNGILHAWSNPGNYPVKVRAYSTQCAPNETVPPPSNWSEVLEVTVTGSSAVETVSPPTKPVMQSVDSHIVAKNEYWYSTGGSLSNLNHPVEYQFDWGDGSVSEWGVASQSKTWINKGTYNLKARAQCKAHTNIVSDWSGALTIEVVEEKISTPTLIGSSVAKIGEPLVFRAADSSIDLDHGYDIEVEYLIGWGDGTVTDWFIGNDANGHSWTGTSKYWVTAQARCPVHQKSVSSWSEPIIVDVKGPDPGEEIVISPKAIEGPSRGKEGKIYAYSTGGSFSTSGHSIRYQFDWGPEKSGWLPEGVNGSSTSWNTPGWKFLTAQAKCGVHDVFSGKSAYTGVYIGDPQAPPKFLLDPSERPPGVNIGFILLRPQESKIRPPENGNSGPSALVSHNHAALAADTGSSTDESQWWAGGYDTENKCGVLLRYANGQWRMANLPNVSSDWDLKAIDFISPTEGWAVGQDHANKGGMLLHYTNDAWSVVSPPTVSSDWGLDNLRLTSSTEGWAVGYDSANKRGVLLHYSNGSWSVGSPPSVSSDWEVRSLYFISPTEGWTIGNDFAATKGVLFHYQNGGWSVVNPLDVSTVWDLSDVHFTSSNEGWAVGYDYVNQRGVLLHYLNGSWTSVNPPAVSSDWDLRSVHFTFPEEGWAVGYDNTNKRGVLLWYSGDSWESVLPPEVSSNWELTGIQLTPNGEVWAVGNDLEKNQGVFLKLLPPPEGVSPPWAPFGPSSGNTGTDYSYTAVGSKSSLGHGLEYQFDWQGDGSDLSTWGSSTQSKTWTSAGTYNVKTKARCAVDKSIESNWSDTLAVSISTPAQQPNLTPYQPTGWSDKIVVSNVKGTKIDSTSLYNTDPLYVDWAVINNGTSSASGYSVGFYVDGVLRNTWSSCPVLKANASWSIKDYPIGPLSVGTHAIKVAVGSNEYTKTINILDISTAINLTTPSDSTSFGACSLYSPPTFSWDIGDTFKSYKIQFSSVQDCSVTSVTVGTSSNSTVINSNTWKKVLSIPGGTVYWRVVGTRMNRSIATSKVCSIGVEPAQTIGNPSISDTSKSSLPTLSWENNCNKKFKVWFGSDSSFVKKATFAFNVMNPTDNGGVLTKTLTSGQWTAIRKLVGDVSGSTISWYVESWDGLNRYAKTDPMSFVLTD